MLYTAEDIFWITNNFVAFAHKLDACRDHEHRLNRTFRSETAGVDVGRANRGRVMARLSAQVGGQIFARDEKILRFFLYGSLSTS